MTPSLSDPARERLEAHLALALPAPAPTGTPPTLEEIDAWRRGRLPAARASEVRAYVARDPVYYQQWFELRQAAAEATAPAAPATRAPRPGLRERLAQGLRELWRTPVLIGGGLATALGLVLAVTLLLPGPAPPEWTRLLAEDQARWGSLAGWPT